VLMQIDLSFWLDVCRWSERYYLDPDTSDMRRTMDDLVDARMFLAAYPTRLTNGRAVNWFGVRFPLQVTYDRLARYKDLPGIFVQQDNLPAFVPELSIGMGFRTLQESRRILWLSGFPCPTTRAFHPDVRIILNVAYADHLRAFRDKLESKRFNLQLRVFGPAAGGERFVRALDVTDEGLYRLTLDEGPPFKPQDRVRFLGARGVNLACLRGIRRIRRVEAPDVVVMNAGPRPQEPPPSYISGARLVPVEYGFQKGFWYPTWQGTTKSFFGPFGLFPHTHRWEYLVASRQRGMGIPARRGRERKPCP
jgi:hypothetical protein